MYFVIQVWLPRRNVAYIIIIGAIVVKFVNTGLTRLFFNLSFCWQITPGEKRLYQLKNKSLESRVKGHLILTLDVAYNPVRASVRTINPRDPKVMYEPPKFKRAVMVHVHCIDITSFCLSEPVRTIISNYSPPLRWIIILHFCYMPHKWIASGPKIYFIFRKRARKRNGKPFCFSTVAGRGILHAIDHRSSQSESVKSTIHLCGM